MWSSNIPRAIAKRYVPSAGDGILPASKKHLESKKYRKLEAELHKLADPKS